METEKFTFADGLLLAVDLKANDAMPGRDGLRKLTGLNEGQARKIIDMIKGGFADYFFSKKRKEIFRKIWREGFFKNAVSLDITKYRLAEIHDADIENFKFWKG